MPPLHPSWHRAWTAIGATGDGAQLRDRLLACYAEPHRHYHTLQHLTECLDMLAPLAALAEHPGEVEVALYFHDAIYNVRASDNEQQSADWAQRELRLAGVRDDAAARVHALVLATRHDALPVGADQQLLVDIDLSILGAAPARFEEYERQIRREYAWVPSLIFRPKRRAILAAFLARPTIFSCAPLRERLEAAARANLQQSLAQLGG